MYIFFSLLLSYLLGSLPTSIVVGRLFFGRDPRNEGSGNAGATNTFRVFGWKAGIPVMLIDIGKGAAAVLLVSRIAFARELPNLPLNEETVVQLLRFFCGVAAVAGHIWTVFAGFKGGKGVATAYGMLLALYPVSVNICLFFFLLALTFTGFVSAASLTAAVTFPLILLAGRFFGLLITPNILFFLSLPVSLLIIWTHRKNLLRLFRGEESRFTNLMLFRKRRKRKDKNHSERKDQQKNK